MIKVVHLSNHDIALKIHMRNMLFYLRDKGYDVSVACNPGEYLKKDMVTEDGFFVKAIPMPSKISPIIDLITLLKLTRHFIKQRFDIVHTHTIKPGLLGRIAARLAGVPIVIHTIHGFPFHDEMPPGRHHLYVNVEKIAALFCDLMISQNVEDIGTAVKLGICRQKKLGFLGNGIDLNAFRKELITPDIIQQKRDEIGIAQNQKVVVLIGRLVKEKGFYEYIKAAKTLSDRGLQIVFLAVGVKHLKREALDPEQFIRAHGLQENFLHLGKRNDIRELIAMVDLVVLPSYAEGIPRVLMEAAAMSKAVVATNVRGTRELVIHGKTGLLVPVKDQIALADAIEALLNSPERIEQMGLAARKQVEENFNEQTWFERTDRFYRELIERKIPNLALKN